MKDQIKSLLAKYIAEEHNIIGSNNLDDYTEKIFLNATILAHYEQGKLAGFIAYYNNHPSRESAFLTMLIVDRDFRSTGLGKRLLCQSLADLRKKQYKKILLEVKTENSRAVSMYERNGFKKIEERGDLWLMEAYL